MDCPWCEVTLFDDDPGAAVPIHSRREALNDGNPIHIHTVERCDQEFMSANTPMHSIGVVRQALQRGREMERADLFGGASVAARIHWAILDANATGDVTLGIRPKEPREVDDCDDCVVNEWRCPTPGCDYLTDAVNTDAIRWRRLIHLILSGKCRTVVIGKILGGSVDPALLEYSTPPVRDYATAAAGVRAHADSLRALEPAPPLDAGQPACPQGVEVRHFCDAETCTARLQHFDWVREAWAAARIHPSLHLKAVVVEELKAARDALDGIEPTRSAAVRPNAAPLSIPFGKGLPKLSLREAQDVGGLWDDWRNGVVYEPDLTRMTNLVTRALDFCFVAARDGAGKPMDGEAQDGAVPGVGDRLVEMLEDLERVAGCPVPLDVDGFEAVIAALTLEANAIYEDRHGPFPSHPIEPTCRLRMQDAADPPDDPDHVLATCPKCLRYGEVASVISRWNDARILRQIILLAGS